MKLPRRNFLQLAAGVAAPPAVTRSAWAQAYPSRPVRCIVVYAPGGGTDIFVRLVGQSLPARLGQPFVIENRAGASSNIATEQALRHETPSLPTAVRGNFTTYLRAARHRNSAGSRRF